MSHVGVLSAAGLDKSELASGNLIVNTPVVGSELAHLRVHRAAEVEDMIAKATAVFQAWRTLATPRALKSAAPSVARKKPGVGANPAPKPGKVTCAGRLIR